MQNCSHRQPARWSVGCLLRGTEAVSAVCSRQLADVSCFRRCRLCVTVRSAQSTWVLLVLEARSVNPLMRPFGRYDDLRNYSNERSVVLAEVREAIEQPWQAWELAQADTDRYRSMSPAEVCAALLALRCLKPCLWHFGDACPASVARCASFAYEATWCWTRVSPVEAAGNFDRLCHHCGHLPRPATTPPFSCLPQCIGCGPPGVAAGHAEWPRKHAVGAFQSRPVWPAAHQKLQAAKGCMIPMHFPVSKREC